MAKNNRSQLIGPSIVWETALPSGKTMHICATTDFPRSQQMIIDFGYMRKQKDGSKKFVASNKYEERVFAEGAIDQIQKELAERMTQVINMAAAKLAEAAGKTDDPVLQRLVQEISDETDGKGEFVPEETFKFTKAERIPNPQ